MRLIWWAKSASLGGQSASLGGQSASLGGQSASLGGQSASLGGQNRRKPSDGDKTLPMAPKARPTLESSPMTPKAHPTWVKRLMVQNSASWKKLATLWFICALFSPKLSKNGRAPKTPKEGKKLPLELHNFRKIDFGEILTSFDRMNKGSRLWIRVFFTRSKNFFWDLVLVRGRRGAKTGWVMLGPGPKLFSSPFFCSTDLDARCILRDVWCNWIYANQFPDEVTGLRKATLGLLFAFV